MLRRLARRVASLGMGDSAMSGRSRALAPRTRGLTPTVSVCPYCAVGCSQLVYHRDGKILDVEGNPDSPINAGTLCPKGAATLGLMNSPQRIDRVLHRAPHAREWRTVPLDWAMDRIAHLTRQVRDESFVGEAPDGTRLNHTMALGSMGGATLDNEENYLIKKLFSAGLGMVFIENQARV